MNNNEQCAAMREAILASDSEFSATVLEHIKQCSACKTLAEDWRQLREVKLPETSAVSPSLDFAVLSAAGKAQSRHRWMLPKWFYATSSAACAVLFAWLVVYSQHYEARKKIARWKTPNNNQSIFILETAFNQTALNSDQVTDHTMLRQDAEDQEINAIVATLPDVTSDSDLFDSLLQSANEVKSL